MQCVGLGLSLALGLACSGCSLLFMPSPPSDPSERTVEASEACTTSFLTPGFDTLNAVIGVASYGIATSAKEGEQVSWYSVEMSKETAQILSVVQVIAFAGSAGYGYVQADRCKALRMEVAGANPQRARQPRPSSPPPRDGEKPAGEYVTE